MTNTDKIEKIRRKVKELQDEFISIHPKDCSLELIKSYAGYAYLDKVLSFIDTLDSEKPVPKDLDFEQELYNHFGQIRDFTLGMRIGQYFYNLGRDSVPLSEDTVLFQKGVEEGKRLMMEEAVEGTVTCHNLNRYILVSGLDESLTYGDKVRVIVCKKED